MARLAEVLMEPRAEAGGGPWDVTALTESLRTGGIEHPPDGRPSLQTCGSQAAERCGVVRSTTRSV